MKQSEIEVIIKRIKEPIKQESKVTETLYKEWLLNNGFEEKHSFEELTPTGQESPEHKEQFVDVTGDPEYQGATDIDFELSVIPKWCKREQDLITTWQDKNVIQHVEIKAGESILSGNRYTNLQIETIANADLYKGEFFPEPKKLRGKEYRIVQHIGWWNKNPDYQADMFCWILMVYGTSGSQLYTSKPKNTFLTQEEFKTWKNESGRQPTDRIVTEVPMGLMLRLSRSAIQAIIDDNRIQKETKKGKGHHFTAYNIPLELIERRIEKYGWTPGAIEPAIPIVRYLTAESKYTGKDCTHGSKHFEGVELLASEKYRYYIPRRMLYSVYKITETHTQNVIAMGDTILVPSADEDYTDAPKVEILGYGCKGRDGSLRRLTRIAMHGIEAWGECPTTHPFYMPEKEELPF